MIAKIKMKSGDSGSSINYILGGKVEKDQIVQVIGYNGFALSEKMRQEIELVPTTVDERRLHKQQLWQYTQKISAVFDARASLADYRVNKAFEEYKLGFSPEDLPLLTPELHTQVLNEFLEGMGIQGDISVKYRRKSGNVTKKEHREAVYLACAHLGTNAPHVHLFTCRVDDNGKVNDTRDERLRALAVCRAISKKYNLHLKLNESAGITTEKGYTLTEKPYEPNRQKNNEGTERKLSMRDAVMHCLRTATSWDELTVKLLQYAEISVDFKYHAETNKAYGVLFSQAVPPKRGFDYKFSTYSGTQLDRSLSFGKIEKQLNANRQLALKKEAAVAEEQKINELTTAQLRRLFPYVDDAYKQVSAAYTERKKLWTEKGEINQQISTKYAEISQLYEDYRDMKDWYYFSKSKECLRFAGHMMDCGIIGVPFVIIGILMAILMSLVEEPQYDPRQILVDIDKLRLDIENLKYDRMVINHKLNDHSKEQLSQMKKEALSKLAQARKQIQAPVVMTTPEVTKPVVPAPKSFLEIVSQGISATPGNKEKIYNEYQLTLATHENNLVKYIKKTYKENLWRAVKVTDLTISSFNGDDVTAKCHVSINGRIEPRIRIDRNANEARISQIAEKYVELFSSSFDVNCAINDLGIPSDQIISLQKENFYVDHCLNLSAVAIATNYGKHYVLLDGPIEIGQEVRYYVSEPLSPGKPFNELSFYGKDGQRWTKEQVVSAAKRQEEPIKQKVKKETPKPTPIRQMTFKKKGRGI